MHVQNGMNDIMNDAIQCGLSREEPLRIGPNSTVWLAHTSAFARLMCVYHNYTGEQVSYVGQTDHAVSRKMVAMDFFRTS